MQRSWIPIDAEVLRRLYVEEQRTIEEIAAHFGCCATTISRRLRAATIRARRRGPNPARRHGARMGDLPRPQITWSPTLAWIVGLITTDGNLSRQRSFSITSKDRDLLELVQHHLRLRNPITPVRGGWGTACSRLQWGDRRLYDWLAGIGLTPAKSLTLKPLAVPDEYFPDFLRGCIDGDGCILTYTDRYHAAKKSTYVYERLYVTVVSASRAFIAWLLATIRRLLAVRGSMRVTVRSERDHPVYAMRFAKSDSIRILHWIYYTDDVPCLGRKRLKAAPFLLAKREGILAAGECRNR